MDVDHQHFYLFLENKVVNETTSLSSTLLPFFVSEQPFYGYNIVRRLGIITYLLKTL